MLTLPVSESLKNVKHPSSFCRSWEKEISTCILKPRQLSKKKKKSEKKGRKKRKQSVLSESRNPTWGGEEERTVV